VKDTWIVAETWIVTLLVSVMSSVPFAAPAQAEEAARFYSGKVISLYIGFSPGGGYDTYARLVARHLGEHIPGNPTIVPVNMEGAGSLRLANWMFNVAPRDGTAIGTVNRGVPFEPLLGNAEFAEFDARQFTWIGSANDETTVCAAMSRTNISDYSALYDSELIVGGTGPGADDFVMPKLVSGYLGLNLRLVSGYAGGNDVEYAMERGEVDGRCGWSWSTIKSTRQNWLANREIHILMQVGLTRHPDLPDVPSLIELARTEEERQVLFVVLARGALGRPFFAPPGIPPQRAEALRAAFSAMVTDPDFLQEAERSRLEITPVTGAALTELMEEAYRTPAPLIERARHYLQ